MHISTLLAEHVETYLETNLNAEFVTRGLGDYAIKVGRLQDNPEKPGSNLMVHVQKPRDEQWIDQPAGNRYVPARNRMGIMSYEMGDEFAIGEVGGGRTWLRRFSVEVSVFFTRTKESRVDANRIANIIRGLVEWYLKPEICIGVEDEWGERAYRTLLGPSSAQERGGPKALIWDIWVYFSVETMRPE